MYKMYFGTTRFPIPPEELEVNIGSNNETITLINGQEISILKSPKITEISFDVLLPNHRYEGITDAETMNTEDLKDTQKVLDLLSMNQFSGYFLSLMEQFKENKKSFKFKLIRSCENPAYDDINMLVSLEDYSIKETNEDNGDVTVSVALKKYVKHTVKKIKLKKKKVTVKESARASKKNKKSYKTKKGDTMYLIAKKFYHTTNKAIQIELYRINKKAIDKKCKGGKWDMRTLPSGVTLKIPKGFTVIGEGVREK